jgi:TolB-like protein
MSIAVPAVAEFKKTKIAVLDFQLQGKGFDTADMGKIVAEWLITALVKEGRFEVIERRLLEKIINEQRLVMEGVVDTDNAVQLGKLLGVKVIISGSVMKFQNIIEANARIIDVKDASIIAAESVKSNTASRLEDLVIEMAQPIIKDFPLEGYVVNRKGAKVVIDLGRRAGVKPGMRFMAFKEGNIIKHPKTGEVLDVEKIQTGILEITSVSQKIATARIVDPKNAKGIAYGQMVKSLVKPSRIIHDYSEPVTPTEPKASPPPVVRSTYNNLTANEVKYLNMLQSNDMRSKRVAAKTIFKQRLFKSHILEVVNDQLLNGHTYNIKNRHQIDYMAYLCKILGASGRTQYRSTLKTVSRAKVHKKLKAYAKKSYKLLK